MTLVEKNIIYIWNLVTRRRYNIMSNKVYDILKYVAMIALPAVATLYAALAAAWGWSNAEQIVATITAIDTFLGTLLQISSSKYKKGE